MEWGDEGYPLTDFEEQFLAKTAAHLPAQAAQTKFGSAITPNHQFTIEQFRRNRAILLHIKAFWLKSHLGRWRSPLVWCRSTPVSTATTY